MNRASRLKNGADFKGDRLFTKSESEFTGINTRYPKQTTEKIGGNFEMNVRNEIKAQIIRTGMTMQEVVDLLSQEYGWSDSVSNLSAKLQRESIRYKEVLELADVLGYEIVWQKRRDS